MTLKDKLTLEALFYELFSNLMEDFIELCKSLEEHQKKTGQKEIEVEASAIWLDGTIPSEKAEADPYEAPRALFWAVWNEIKMECYRRRIYLEEEAVVNFFITVIPYSYVWKKLVIGDDDFTTFRTMKIKDELDMRYSVADEKQKAEIAKSEKILSILNICFERTQKPAPQDRMAKPFNDELILVIEKLEKDRIRIDIHRLKALITRVLPDHFPQYLLKLVDQYEARLENIKEKAPAEKKSAEAPEEEIVDLVELVEEPLKISEPTIDPTSGRLIMAESSYIIGLGGLRDAIDMLMGLEIYKPMDYKTKLKELITKIRIYCRDKQKLDGLIKIIHELEKHYQKLHMKNYSEKIKNDHATKVAFTYTTLQLTHASMAESMAFGFTGKGGTVKIQ
jgi:hypothetical protein